MIDFRSIPLGLGPVCFRLFSQVSLTEFRVELILEVEDPEGAHDLQAVPYAYAPMNFTGI